MAHDGRIRTQVRPVHVADTMASLRRTRPAAATMTLDQAGLRGETPAENHRITGDLQLYWRLYTGSCQRSSLRNTAHLFRNSSALSRRSSSAVMRHAETMALSDSRAVLWFDEGPTSDIGAAEEKTTTDTAKAPDGGRSRHRPSIMFRCYVLIVVDPGRHLSMLIVAR